MFRREKIEKIKNVAETLLSEMSDKELDKCYDEIFGVATITEKVYKIAEEATLNTKTVTGILEKVKQEICDGYCKYPTLTKREGELFEDNSPCMECPLTRL